MDCTQHGGPGRRVWRKAHLGTGGKTPEIRAAEATGDSPVLQGLLNRIPPGQEIAGVTADGACGTRRCHDASPRGAHAGPAAGERRAGARWGGASPAGPPGSRSVSPS